MSLLINVEKVKALLLADGWHNCVEGSFTIDAYEYTGTLDNPDHFISAGVHGYTFEESGGFGGHLSGPMEAVLAVRT